MKAIFKKIICVVAGAALLACAPVQYVYNTRVASAEGVENMQTAYDLEELLTPIWEGKTCYQESALPVARSTSQRVEIPLLYEQKVYTGREWSEKRIKFLGVAK